MSSSCKGVDDRSGAIEDGDCNLRNQCHVFRPKATFTRAGFAEFFFYSLTYLLKGNCSGKKILFFIPSIDRVCGTDAQEKKLDFLHGSVRRYKTLRSSTNCGCGHLMTHIVGIAITNSS